MSAPSPAGVAAHGDPGCECALAAGRAGRSWPWRRAAISSAADERLRRRVWQLAWPAIAHMLLITLVFVVDRVIVGRCSATALASLQLSTTLTWTVYCVLTSLSVGTMAVVARHVGRRDQAAAACAVRISLLGALLLGSGAGALLLGAHRPLLSVLFPAAGAEVLAEARSYLLIVAAIFPCAFVEAIGAACLHAAGDTRTPLCIAAGGNLLNLLLSSLLVSGCWGLPALGVSGAALGSAAAFVVQAGALLGWLASSRSPLPPLFAGGWERSGRFTAWLRHHREAARQVLRVSLPAMAEKLCYHAGYIGYVAIIALLGAEAMAANQALISIEAVACQTADGIAVAAAALVAQRLGAGRPAEASRACFHANTMAIAALSGMGLMFALAPRLLMSAFTTDPAVLHAGAQSLVVAAIAQPFMAFATVTGMALRGAGDTRTPLCITLVCSVIIRLGATWLLAVTLGLGLMGVWLGSTADWIARSLLLSAVLARGRWRHFSLAS